MDAFESIIATLLWEEGYWTSTGFKVSLSKKAKKGLGKPSLPRPEIDILGYRADDNHLLWVECKSFMDSRGVKIEDLNGENIRNAERYKVFTWRAYRQQVTDALIKQLVSERRVQKDPNIQYCLVTGKIATKTDREKLHAYFQRNEWILHDEIWVKQKLELLAKKGYENDISIQVAKLFLKVK
jgi:hypothetical protein